MSAATERCPECGGELALMGAAPKLTLKSPDCGNVYGPFATVEEAWAAIKKENRQIAEDV